MPNVFRRAKEHVGNWTNTLQIKKYDGVYERDEASDLLDVTGEISKDWLFRVKISD